MDFGVDISQHQQPYEEIRARAKWAEEAKFTGAWVFDHLKPLYGDSSGPCLEGWTLLAALAEATERIRLGTLVTGITYRHPSMLAAEAVAVDHISEGRLDLGVGAAWFAGEHREFGFDFPSPAQRVRRLEEGISILDALMTQDGASFEGRYYNLRNASYNPKPVQRPRPPLWIGGSGEQLMMPLVARRADVWHTWGNPRSLRAKSRRLDELCERAGRDPASVRRTTGLSISEPFDEVRSTIAAFADIGVTYLTVSWPSEGKARIEDFAQKVMPEFAGA